MRVEPQGLEADIFGMEEGEGYNVSDGGTFSEHALGEKIGAHGGVRFGMV